MMMNEFTERTGYTPSFEEYHFIEQSYYDFDGDKDAFCKQWLKDKKDGHWQREMTLRKDSEERLNALRETIAKNEEDILFYQAIYEKYSEQKKALKEAQEKLERLERCFRRTFDVA